MELSTYEAIVSVVEKQMHEKDCMKTLSREFPKVAQETLLSIYSQCYQGYTKAVHGGHRKPEAMKNYYSQYAEAVGQSSELAGDQKTNIILDMSRKIHFSPSLFARIILEQHALAHGLLPSATGAPSTLVSQWMKNPNKIPDKLLQLQVKTCILNDTNYGQLAENIKQSVGYEYEFLLKEKIDKLQIPYLDEKALRIRGYDKTPDFRLEVPIAVGDYVVNWIESKASFGDKKCHGRYLEDQFWSYQNRFGSGLVIYWFGYIEELNIHLKQGIILMDHFPSTVTTLSPQTLTE